MAHPAIVEANSAEELPCGITVERKSSAELAGVIEVPTPQRVFKVEHRHGGPSIVVLYCVHSDKLWCGAHKTYDACSCATRIRLCGILTNSVTYDARVYRNRPAAPVAVEG